MASLSVTQIFGAYSIVDPKFVLLFVLTTVQHFHFLNIPKVSFSLKLKYIFLIDKVKHECGF